MHSKRLSYGYEVLGGFDSGKRIQVVADIETHRPNRRRIPQADPNRVRVVRAEVVESDRLIYVAAVIKSHDPESLLDRYWNAQL